MTTEEVKDFGVGSKRWWRNRRWMTWLSFILLSIQLPLSYFGFELTANQSTIVSGVNWALVLIILSYFGLNSAEQIMAIKKK